VRRRDLIAAGCLTDANPARDPPEKLPKMAREEPQPPSTEHLEAILRDVDTRHLLPWS
jgi:hypothetical protein